MRAGGIDPYYAVSPAATQMMNSVGLGPWGCVARTATPVRDCSTAGNAPCGGDQNMAAALAAGTT